MKRFSLSVLFALASIFSVLACRFDLSPEEKDKKTCRSGETFVINVRLTTIHRNCHTAPEKTKFKTDGLKVLGVTHWKETNTGTWTRKIKVKVLNDPKKKATLSASRSCDKEGGYGILTLDKLP